MRRHDIISSKFPISQRAAPANQEAAFRDFSASQLHCPKCKRSMPVRQKLLLVLADGALYDYCCVQCGSSLGTRKA